MGVMDVHCIHYVLSEMYMILEHDIPKRNKCLNV